jgi:EmrB/QacA subfamily drug resistance transporter
MTTTATPAERRTTIVALLIVLLLGALDQTVVSTAMPRIVAELKGIELYPWVTTVYLLTSTVMVPIWGKLGDLYGRKAVLIVGVLVFTLGSWLCGLAGELGSDGMIQLILFRGLQGIGGGALFTSAFAVIADLYPPRERGKLSGYFGAMFGLASVLGPVIGGFFTEHGTVTWLGVTIEGWRWCFYVNLPLSLLALFMIMTRTPHLSRGTGGKVDLLGAALIVTAFVPLLLALSWGGHRWAWTSPEILGLFATTVVSLLLFTLVESRAPEPMVPLGLFRIPAFTWSNLAAFVLSMAFLGVVTYLPLYLQLGLGLPATESGIALLPLMLGLILSAGICGRLVTRTGRYKPFMIGGAAALALGVFLLARLGPHATMFDLAWRLLLAGAGLGPGQSLFSLAVQNAVAPQRIGVATSTSQFFRQIGSTVGVAVFGALLTNRLAYEMARLRPGGGERLGLEQLQAMTLQDTGGVRIGAERASALVDPSVKTAFGLAMSDLFMAGLFVVLLGIALIFLIPELPLRRHVPPEPVAEPGEGYCPPGEEAEPAR